MPLPTYTGKVSVPQSDLSGLIIDILSIITLLSVAPEPTYAPCMTMEFFDDCVLADGDAAEENAVFNLALYLAAVGNEAVF